MSGRENSFDFTVSVPSGKDQLKGVVTVGADLRLARDRRAGGVASFYKSPGA